MILDSTKIRLILEAKFGGDLSTVNWFAEIRLKVH